jgi:hypothetical protein
LILKLVINFKKKHQTAPQGTVINFYICINKEVIIMKPDISTNEVLFKPHKSYTPEDVFAAGGTTAFGLMHGNNNESLIKALESVAKPEPFTDEEWEDLLSDLAKDK